MKINSVCIVGGGSAGWMSAAALATTLPNLKITLVESPNIPTIGVGESTIKEINKFLDAIQVKDSEWMKECDASFKLGINFVNFNEVGKSFIYPFVHRENIKDPSDWLLFKHINPKTEYTFGDVVSPEIVLMSQKNKITDNHKLPRFCVNRELNFNAHAYQVDAAKLAIFLRNKIGIPSGVTHILGNVVDYCVKDDKLHSIKTDEGAVVEADLFIDCTGFKSSILEGVFKTKHSPFKHLLNDSAYFAQIPYTEETKEKELELVTDCTAINNGWVWNIPLWSRVGTGYVYSSKHIDKESAKSEYIDHLAQRYGRERAVNAKIKSLEIRNGRHENAWVSNVVAIGLSYGFIEPLESTGLWFVQTAILNLIEVLRSRQLNVGGAERHLFNQAINDIMDNTSWWVAMHFFLSKRSDTQYWKDCVDKADLSSVKINNFYINFLMETLLWNRYHDNGAFNFIAYSMGVYPSYSESNNVQQLYELRKNKFLKEREEILKTIDSFPTHYEYLKNTIYSI